MAIYIAPRAHEKAEIGPGAVDMTYLRPLWSVTGSRSPQRMAEQAQTLYRTHPWVHAAEKAVSGRGGVVPWHLEDANDNEVPEDASGPVGAIRLLIEKPQANVGTEGQYNRKRLTRRELWTITLRHMGLCGTAFWYLDQTEALGGTPLGIIYIRPDRMWPAEDAQGNLLGWSLDAPPGEKGSMPLDLASVLTFYLDPPDYGHFGIGLVESLGMKASLSTAADRYIGDVLASGGRLAGLVSPKPNTTISEDQWRQFVNDARQIAEDPQSAKRLQAVRGPIDFARTAATPNEVAVVDVANASRDDILAHWNVPGSQIGIPITRALGQGSAQAFEEAVLWQNAISPRLAAFYETIQYGLLDRFATLGTTVELVIDEPEFDDDTPKYDLAQKAVGQPLTRNQRLAILGLPPLPDWDPDTGDPLGIAIDLPIQVSVVGHGASEEPRPNVPQATVLPANQPLLPPVAGTVDGAPSQVVGKAQLHPRAAALHGSLRKLRANVEKRVTPTLKGGVKDVLATQRRDIAQRIRANASHIKSKPKDSAIWFPKSWDAKLSAVLAPALAGMAESVSTHIRSTLTPGKAAPLATYPIGTRVTGINETTRLAIEKAIQDAIDAGDDILTVADAIEGVGLGYLFDEYRAEMIARTELMDAYNGAALSSYGEAGVTEVQAIDGDGDDECAARDGAVMSVEEADGIEDHPNGTLDWAPVFSGETP